MSIHDVASILATCADTTMTRDGRPCCITNGYAVGGSVAPLVLPRDGMSDPIEQWLSAIPATVAYVGVWLNGGQRYIDGIDLIADRAAAIELANVRGELAIYAFHTHEVIAL